MQTSVYTLQPCKVLNRQTRILTGQSCLIFLCQWLPGQQMTFCIQFWTEDLGSFCWEIYDVYLMCVKVSCNSLDLLYKKISVKQISTVTLPMGYVKRFLSITWHSVFLHHITKLSQQQRLEYIHITKLFAYSICPWTHFETECAIKTLASQNGQWLMNLNVRLTTKRQQMVNSGIPYTKTIVLFKLKELYSCAKFRRSRSAKQT